MLLETIKSIDFEHFHFDRLTLDCEGRYGLHLDRGFPLHIQFASFPVIRNEVPLNWHERLEILIPVAGQGHFRMGDRVLSFSTGDVIIVDNMKFHGYTDFTGSKRHAVIVAFDADLVYNLGSPLCDFLYLTPFQRGDRSSTPVLRSSDALSKPVLEALGRMVECYLSIRNGQSHQAGCKAFLLQALYHLAQRFGSAETARSEFVAQEERSGRLGILLDRLTKDCAAKITVCEAARIVGMSESRFMKFFKEVAGMTFVGYVTHLRLTNACRWLKETTHSITEVAHLVGFHDPCYFDRRFRVQFGVSPREFRNRK